MVKWPKFRGHLVEGCHPLEVVTLVQIEPSEPDLAQHPYTGSFNLAPEFGTGGVFPECAEFVQSVAVRIVLLSTAAPFLAASSTAKPTDA